MDNKNCGNRVLNDKNISKTIMNDSTDDFQKFIYELFDKNGILNDLRAYLRGHIVDALKNSEIGNSTKCEQRFTQRLDLKFQALNILIAEYLLQQEFNYTSSVFVSEIPLSNMVFNFCKTILNSDCTNEELPRFDEGDIWSIFNYLGIKCDSVHACEIISSYKTIQKPSLLQCILKGVKFYAQNSMQIGREDEMSTISDTSSVTMTGSDVPTSTCHHYASCKTCQNNVKRIKIHYKRKIKEMRENDQFEKFVDFNCLTNNENELKRSDFHKMFDQVMSIYESEIDRVRDKERNKLKQTVQLHAVELQTKKEKLEENFKDREKDLEIRIQEKKIFLWNLAKSLRDQHSHLARAIAVVKQEGLRLNNKEESLKKQLIEAEELLTKRGNEMREQITKEILILETYLLDIKNERDSIIKEKQQLELKPVESKSDSHNTETEITERDSIIKQVDRKSEKSKRDSNNTEINDKKINELIELENKRFLTLENELDVMKNFLKTKFDNNLVEIGTNTDLNNTLNNGGVSEVEGSRNVDETRLRQVVNCLKKQNNININGNYCADTVSPRNDVDFMKNLMENLREENMRLKNLSTQQNIHIEQLTAAQERLQCELNTTLCTVHALRTPSIQPQLSSQGMKPQINKQENNPDGVYKGTTDIRVKKETKHRSIQSTDSEQDIIALREAKLRLKRLEIEAEAVEKSYLEFKRKRTDKMIESTISGPLKQDDELSCKDLYTNTGIQYSSSKIEANYENVMSNFTDTIEQDFEKYLKEYKTNCDINKIVLNNKVLELKKIKQKTETYSESNEIEINKIHDFIATPLAEFRKYYSSKLKSAKNSKERVISTKYTRDEALSPIALDLGKEDHKSNKAQSIEVEEVDENLSNTNIKSIDQINIASDKNYIVTDSKINPESKEVKIKDLNIPTQDLIQSTDVLSNDRQSINNLSKITDEKAERKNIETEEVNINIQNVIESTIIEKPQNTISVLLENTVENLEIPNTDYQIEVTIDVNSDNVMNREIIEYNDNIIKLNPQDSIKEIIQISDTNNINNDTNNINNEIKQNEDLEIAINESLKENTITEISIHEVSKLDSQENMSFDVDNYTSVVSNEGNDSPVSHGASLDDDFWNV